MEGCLQTQDNVGGGVDRIRCPDDGMNKAYRAQPIYPKRNDWKFGWDMDAAWRSSYRNDYIPFCAEKRDLIRQPPNPYRREMQFTWDSVYRTEFQPYRVNRCKLVKKQEVYNPPTGRMYERSMYNRDFPGKYGEAAKTTKKRVTLDPNPPPIDAMSSYQMAFVRHPKPEKPRKKSLEELREESGFHCTPFDGTTTYRRDFIPNFCPNPSKSFKPKRFPKRHDGEFDGMSVYRMTYEPYYYDDGQYEGCMPANEYDQLNQKAKCESLEALEK